MNALVIDPGHKKSRARKKKADAMIEALKRAKSMDTEGAASAAAARAAAAPQAPARPAAGSGMVEDCDEGPPPQSAAGPGDEPEPEAAMQTDVPQPDFFGPSSGAACARTAAAPRGATSP